MKFIIKKLSTIYKSKNRYDTTLEKCAITIEINLAYKI